MKVTFTGSVLQLNECPVAAVSCHEAVSLQEAQKLPINTRWRQGQEVGRFQTVWAIKLQRLSSAAKLEA